MRLEALERCERLRRPIGASHLSLLEGVVILLITPNHLIAAAEGRLVELTPRYPRRHRGPFLLLRWRRGRRHLRLGATLKPTQRRIAFTILAVIGNGRPSRRCCPSAAASRPCLCLDSNCRGGCFFVNGGHFEGILLMGSLFLLFFQGGHFRGGLFLLFKCGRCLFFLLLCPRRR